MKLLHFFIDSFMDYGNLFFWIWTVVHAGFAVRFLWKLKPYELFIAVRYLKSRRKQMVISVITILSVLGVSLGVAALIAVLGGMTGFEEDIKEKILGANSQLSVIKYQEGISDWRAVEEKLRNTEGVTAASPYVERQVLIMREDHSFGVIYRGIDVPTIAMVGDIRRAFEQGIGSLEILLDETGELPPIAIGQDLAYRVGAYIGDEVSILNPQGGLGPFGLRPEVGRYRVAGIFRFGFWEVDANVALVSLQEA